MSNGKVYVVGNDPGTDRMFYERGFEILKGDGIPKADIVCFIGGADINPEIYGQSKNPRARVSLSPSDDKRDTLAWNIIPESTLRVGICRGGQFINVKNGGKLFQDVRGHGNHHKIYDTLWNQEFIVTSSHHQQMIPGPGGDILTYAEGVGSGFVGEFGDMEKPDVEIEGIYYAKSNSLCVQFHPEWKEKDSTEQNYFFNLIDEVR